MNDFTRQAFAIIDRYKSADEVAADPDRLMPQIKAGNAQPLHCVKSGWTRAEIMLPLFDGEVPATVYHEVIPAEPRDRDNPATPAYISISHIEIDASKLKRNTLQMVEEMVKEAMG